MEPLAPRTHRGDTPFLGGVNEPQYQLPLPCQGHPRPLFGGRFWGGAAAGGAAGAVVARAAAAEDGGMLQGCAGKGEKKEPGASPGDSKGQKSVRAVMAPGTARLCRGIPAPPLRSRRVTGFRAEPRFGKH